MNIKYSFVHVFANIYLLPRGEKNKDFEIPTLIMFCKYFIVIVIK